MVRKLFQQMVASQIVSAMAVTLCLLIDSIMIGRFLGVKAMAAYSLTNPVLLIFAAFGALLSTGIQVVCSQAMGSGDEKKINRCFTMSMLIAGIVAAVGVVLVLVFVNPLCTLLGAGENVPGNEVFRLTRRYLIGFVIGAPAFIGAQILVPFMQMAGQRTRLVVAVLAMTVVDVISDILNVFVFEADTLGMGIASTVSYYVALVIGCIYFFKKNCIYKFTTKGLSRGLAREMAMGGVPTVINQVSLVMLVYIINQTMMKLGEESAVAAYSVVSTVANLGYCLGNGVSEVSLMLTGIATSEEDSKSLKEIVKQQTWFAAVINAAAMALFLVFANLLARLFVYPGDSPYSIARAEETVKYATVGLRLFALCLVPSAINAAFKKYYQAIGMIRFSEIISVVQNLCFPAIVVLVLGNAMGAQWGVNAGTVGVWLSYVIGECLTLLFITIVVKRKTGEKFASVESFACIPEGLGAHQDDVLELEILKQEDVEEAALAATAFCKSKNENAKKAMYTSLCIEEMANNILEHGFKPGSSNRIDIRLVRRDNDDLILRIRDNCEGFDPVNYYEMTKPDQEDPTKHIGIRMVFRMVKDVKYVNSLGLNNLTVRI